jgi:hypothetical protein
MPKRWDDIEILQAIDRHQKQSAGAPAWHLDGLRLMEEIAGRPVSEDHRWRGFVQELYNARDAGLLTFHVDTAPGGQPPQPDSNPHYYLQQIRRFALTVAGQDRARGRLVIQPLPDPSEDDGRPISRLILKQVATAIEDEYGPDQIPTFLCESGIPLGRLPLADDITEDDVQGVLVALNQWGSQGRRTLRSFLSRWLDDQLISGPSNELRTALIEQLARQGWYVAGGRLDHGADRPAWDRVVGTAGSASLAGGAGAVLVELLATAGDALGSGVGPVLCVRAVGMRAGLLQPPLARDVGKRRLESTPIAPLRTS